MRESCKKKWQLLLILGNITKIGFDKTDLLHHPLATARKFFNLLIYFMGLTSGEEETYILFRLIFTQTNEKKKKTTKKSTERRRKQNFVTLLHPGGN